MENLQYGVIYCYRHESVSDTPIAFIQSWLADRHEAMGKYSWQFLPATDDSRLTLAVRRVNLGNLGKHATANITFWCPQLAGECISDLEAWATAATDVMDCKAGDIHIDAAGESHFVSCPPDLQEAVAPKPLPSSTILESFSLDLNRAATHKKRRPVRADRNEMIAAEADMDIMIDAEANQLQQEYQQALNQAIDTITRYVAETKSDPEQIIRELLHGIVALNQKPSPLVVNEQLQVILTDFELEIKLSAMQKAVYILFLLHPEGIVLKQIGDYQQQLSQIYYIVKPGRDEVRAHQQIATLCEPASESLHQTISKINHAVKRHLTTAEHIKLYTILGNRGTPYRIDLPRDQVTLPAIFG